MNNMKKMNNKGFAITTLLYGLMSVGFLVMTLLMGIMSQNRQNTSTLVKKIEEELNRYGETETTFAYIGTPQEYIVPYGQAGWYKIELWGAKTSSGLGDYTSGIVYLAENTKLYFYLGNTCANATACGTAFNKGNTEVRTNTATETSAIMRASGYGKTSYIAGYAGSNSLSEAGAATNQTNHFSGKYFINGMIVPKVNDTYGKANVELVSKGGSDQYPTMKNLKLSEVRYIKHCSNGNTLKLAEIQAIDIKDGKNIIKTLATSNFSGVSTGTINDGIINTSSSTVSSCMQVDLGAVYNLSELAIWHDYSSSTSYKGNTLQVSKNGSTWLDIKKNDLSSTTAPSSSSGERFTPWQADSTVEFPSGRYYIFSITNPSKVLTAQNAREITAPNKANVTTETFQGSKLQKWTIERVYPNDTNLMNKSGWTSTPIYRIYESENNHALQLADGTSEIGENINAAKPVRNYEWDLWQILPLGNGTYKIRSLITAGANRFVYENSTSNVISYTDTSSDTDYRTRFRIVNAEY